MKKTGILLFTIISVFIANAAGPKGLKKLRNAQVTLVSYSQDGSMKEGQGVFVNKEGSVITDYDILKGAAKAIVIDNEGNEFPVTEIAGADAMYNVVKLNVNVGKKKITPLISVTNPEDSMIAVYIMPSAKADKKVPCTIDTITKADVFNKYYYYYSLKNAAPERLANCPVLNKDGLFIGLLHLAARDGKPSFVIDAKFADSMKINTMDAVNADLKAIKIKKALPNSEQDAASFIFLTDKADTTLYNQYIAEFINKYPTSSTGYTLKSEALIVQENYKEADEIYEMGLAQEGIKKDELYFSRSKAIYTLSLSPKYNIYNNWNLEFALEQANKAYQTNPLPTYTHQEALCLYALKRYQEAGEKFQSLSQTTLRSAETFMYAAQCKQMSKSNPDEILALMDSALNCYSKPYPADAANIILIRAATLGQHGKYRDAVIGYNDYERLAGNNLAANFYYEREQLEVKCRMYPAALYDIEKAIMLSPREPVLYAEAAALNYRVEQLDDAIFYCQKAIELDAKYADPYRILGVCMSLQGKKADAKKYLLKAKELGDTMVDNILKTLE